MLLNAQDINSIAHSNIVYVSANYDQSINKQGGFTKQEAFNVYSLGLHLNLTIKLFSSVYKKYKAN